MLQFFKNAEVCGPAAPVLFQLLRVGFDGFAGDELGLGLAAADADRELRRAGAGGGPAAELVLHQPVLKGVEGDDAEASARCQMLKNGVHALFQRVQLVIDRNAQRLEGAAGRVLVLAALGGGHGAGHVEDSTPINFIPHRLDGRAT